MGARTGYFIGTALWVAGIIAIPAIAHDHSPPIISIPTDGSGSNSPSSRAGLLSLMGTLRSIRSQLRSLENQAEIENHRIARLRAQQQSFFADFDRQLRKLNHGAAAPSDSVAPQSPPDAASSQARVSSSTTGPSSGVTVIPPNPALGAAPQGAAPPAVSSQSSPPTVPAPAPGAPSAKAAYGRAFDMLRAGRYRHAVSAFQAFLQTYPGDKRASKAQYWVAETDYVEREYSKAHRAFKTLVTRYPESKKVPNALLKMGYIAKWQGHANKARSTWRGLIAHYPKSMAAQVARNSLTNLGPKA